MPSDYNEELKKKLTLKLRERLTALPPFIGEFFRGINDVKQPRTKLNYAYDLSIFFNFLITLPKFNDIPIAEFTVKDLAEVTSDDIEMFMEHLTFYLRKTENSVLETQNEAMGKSRKLAAVRTMFSYYYGKGRLTSNPSELVHFPAVHSRNIIRLEANEAADLLDEVESGEKLTDRQKEFHRHNMLRDLAIITLMLGTGMRISECIGIDIEHIDFDIGGVLVTRKGGDQSILYFNDEVEAALSDYLELRGLMVPQPGHEDALFLSMQNRRITDRAVQNLVKKYSRLITQIKNITPHKLRSTYATNLYRETGDIYLVADALGHRDVNTTRKHYAHMDEERRRMAAKHIRLRED